jgi:hypothetical protein
VWAVSRSNGRAVAVRVRPASSRPGADVPSWIRYAQQRRPHRHGRGPRPRPAARPRLRRRLRHAPAASWCPAPSSRSTPEERLAARAAGRRARVVDLRWAARCEEMEAVLDDLAAGLLLRPDIIHVVG